MTSGIRPHAGTRTPETEVGTGATAVQAPSARAFTFDLVAMLREAAVLARAQGVEVRVSPAGAVVIKPVALGDNGQPVDKRSERNRRYYEAQRLKARGQGQDPAQAPSSQLNPGHDAQSSPHAHASLPAAPQETQAQKGAEKKTSQRLNRLNRLKTSESVLDRLNGEGEEAAPLPLSPSLPLSPQTPLSPAHPHTLTPGHKRVREEPGMEATKAEHQPQISSSSSSTIVNSNPSPSTPADSSPDFLAPAADADARRQMPRDLETERPPKLNAWAPDAAQRVVNGWFSRRDTTAWSAKEQKAWKAIPAEAKTDGLIALAPAYTATAGEAFRYRRRDLLTLLNHWQGEIDRWRHFKAPVQSDVRPLQRDYEDPPFLTDDAAIYRPARSASAAARAAGSASTAAAGAAVATTATAAAYGAAAAAAAGAAHAGFTIQR